MREIKKEDLPKEVLEKMDTLYNIFDILNKAEELINNLDPDEKNKDLMTLYRFIHSHNPSHSCFNSHNTWREEFKEFLNNNI